MHYSLLNFVLIVYLAFTLRVCFAQICFGYLLHKRDSLILAPYVCACLYGLLRWPYLAVRYPKLFAREFIIGKSQPKKIGPGLKEIINKVKDGGK